MSYQAVSQGRHAYNHVTDSGTAEVMRDLTIRRVRAAAQTLRSKLI